MQFSLYGSSCVTRPLNCCSFSRMVNLSKILRSSFLVTLPSRFYTTTKNEIKNGSKENLFMFWFCLCLLRERGSLFFAGLIFILTSKFSKFSYWQNILLNLEIGRVFFFQILILHWGDIICVSPIHSCVKHYITSTSPKSCENIHRHINIRVVFKPSTAAILKQMSYHRTTEFAW